jgi:hypothetical protein
MERGYQPGCVDAEVAAGASTREATKNVDVSQYPTEHADRAIDLAASATRAK